MPIRAVIFDLDGTLVDSNEGHIFPGAIELLEALQGRGIMTAIATSSQRAALEETFRSTEFDFESHVNHVIAADQASRTKPAPDVLVAALETLKVAPEECLLVGDTVHDAEAAARSRIPFIGLTCGRCATEEELSAAGAIAVFRDPRDLLESLPQELALAAVEHHV